MPPLHIGDSKQASVRGFRLESLICSFNLCLNSWGLYTEILSRLLTIRTYKAAWCNGAHSHTILLQWQCHIYFCNLKL